MFKIGNQTVGQGRTFVIAEAGINHNGDVNLAKKMIRTAKETGADAVKFQSFRAEIMCDYDLTEEKDVEGVTGGTKSSYDMYKALELTEKGHKELFDYARKMKILCFSSVFDPVAVDWLVKLKSPAIKISSGDLTYLPLIKKAARTRIPLLISTGMADFSEVTLCYERMKQMRTPFALLHCVSEYPLLPEWAHLRVLPLWKQLFECPVGFSDHSEGTLLSETAVALGADILEKHFTLDNEMAGPDQKLSLNPEGFSKMIRNIRDIEKALGSPYKKPTPAEAKGRFNGRRGLKASRNLPRGTQLGAGDFKIIKPASGLSPECLEEVLGLKTRREIQRGKPVTFLDLE